MDRQAWDDRYASADLVWSATPNQFVAAEVAGLVPGRALDVACGEGRNALWLASQGWTVTAVDFSSAGIATGRRRAEEDGLEVDWVVADVVEWEPEPGGFDLVVVAYLQLGADTLRAALGHAVRALAPARDGGTAGTRGMGGTIVAVGHDLRNLDDGYGGPQDPSVLWTPEGVVEACTTAVADLEVERAETVERRVAVDGGERIALDTLVRAHRP